MITDLDLLWSDDVEFFSVYKLNPQGNTNWACNCTDNPSCDGALEPGAEGGPINETHHVRPEDERFPLQPADSQSPTCPHPYPSYTQWPCNRTASVRELLGLGPACECISNPPSLACALSTNSPAACICCARGPTNAIKRRAAIAHSAILSDCLSMQTTSSSHR